VEVREIRELVETAVEKEWISRGRDGRLRGGIE